MADATPVQRRAPAAVLVRSTCLMTRAPRCPLKLHDNPDQDKPRDTAHIKQNRYVFQPGYKANWIGLQYIGLAQGPSAVHVFARHLLTCWSVAPSFSDLISPTGYSTHAGIVCTPARANGGVKSAKSGVRHRAASLCQVANRQTVNNKAAARSTTSPPHTYADTACPTWMAMPPPRIPASLPSSFQHPRFPHTPT